MALESDVNAADAALWVEFYDDTVLQTFQSEQAGRPIYADVVMIQIRIPGNDLNVIKRPMEEGDKRRFPHQWAFYQNKTQDNESMGGTPLSELPGLTKGVVQNLRVAGFHTVEQGAAASDVALQGLKMSVGMNPLAFRERCKAFLAAADDAAPLTQLSAELEKRDAEIAAMKAQIDQLLAMQGGAPPAPPAESMLDVEHDAGPAPPPPKPQPNLKTRSAA